MAYSPVLRFAIGETRHCLEGLGITTQSARMREHGRHDPSAHAPLVVVACSGGRDSLALATVTATVCGMMGVRCGAVIVDHGLIVGSDEVAARAAEQCRGFGMDPVVVRRVTVAATGAGTEADARTARYRALAAEAGKLGADAVLLAHTKDDQAETVMMGVLRTVGLEALVGMPQVNVREGVTFARPFLGLTRAQTTAICETRGIVWWDDPSNGDRADEGGLSTDLPLRSRIRQALLPYLNHFVHTDMVEHLSRSAYFAQCDKEYMDMQAERVASGTVLFGDRAAGLGVGVCVAVDARALAAEHPAIRMRVVAMALRTAGVPVTSRQVLAVEALVSDWHGQGGVRLPSHYSATRQGYHGYLAIVKA